MRKLTLLAALAATTAIASPAQAGDAEGKLQIKVLGTAVLPDGGIDKIKSVAPALLTTLTAAPPVGLGFTDLDSKASDNVVPTIAIEYFATPNVSIETICCLTQHHVNGAADLAGTNLVNHVLILPATVTVKYHLDAGPIKPYVGVGPSLFLIMGEKPGATAKALGVDKVKLSNEVGFALQAGVDIPVNSSGMGISLDAKKYFMNTTAKFYNAAGANVLTTKHELDPWVLSAGVSFRF